MSYVDRALACAVLGLLVAIAVGVLRDEEALGAAVAAVAARLPVFGSLLLPGGARCGLAHTDPRVLSALRSTGGIADGAAAAFGVRSSRVVFAGAPGGEFVEAPATVVVAGGRVLKVVAGGEDDWARDGASREVAHVLDFGALVVMPGFVDAHVHVNEPSVGEEKEGWVPATRAAAAGGVTTVIDMPLNGHKSTIDVARFREKLAAAEGKAQVDFALWGGFVTDNTEDAAAVEEKLRPLLACGVAGVKAFLNKANEAFNFVGREHIEAGLGALADAQVPLIVHAEFDLPPDELPDAARTGDPTSFSTFAASCPREVRPAAAADSAPPSAPTRAPPPPAPDSRSRGAAPRGGTECWRDRRSGARSRCSWTSGPRGRPRAACTSRTWPTRRACRSSRTRSAPART